MPPKRKSEELLAARDKKKMKVAAARTIALQSQAADQQPVAGPSSSVRRNSMQGLPSTLDVEKFAEARSFEIRAMQIAMKNSKDGSSQRSWQQLPRNLRRRAASHDVRRVPLRLRDKARAEGDSVKKKSSSSRPKRGKAMSLSRTESFLKRQRLSMAMPFVAGAIMIIANIGNKLWLESHIWHSKRMHMEDLWGYRLAITPSEKSFRSSHRASIHGSILHDASYFSLIELQGPQHILKRLLEFCCEPLANPASAKYLTGARMCETHIYKAESYPFDLIAPITVLWRPLEDDQQSVNKPAAEGLPTGGLPKSKGKRKSKVKGKEDASTSTTETLEVCRTVWIQSHPSVWDDVFKALQLSASFSLEWVNKSPGGVQKDYGVDLIDLRQHVNVFEIMGPKSNQVVRGALTAVPDDNRTEFKEFWSLLKDIQSSGQLASGMVIALKVQDPRLNFPPKNVTARLPEDINLLPSYSFPSSKLARSEIWDKDLLAGIKNPRYKKKDLDERRSKNTIPGTALPPQREDDRIPILLVQRSLRNSSQSLHGWTLIVPAGWSMPFLSSLVYTGTRVGGQRERQTQSFEAGLPYFPRDYPSTEQYTTYSNKREEEEKAGWERKPPAKRVNYEKMGTRSPWKPDWKVVLGLQTTEDSDLVAAQRDILGDTRPWLLRGPAVPSILNNICDMFNPLAGLLAEINRIRVTLHNDPLRAPFKADDLWDGALVSVRLIMIGRGCPEDFAMIYQLEDEELANWKQSRQKAGTAQMSLDDIEEDQLQFLHTSSPIIGYVTTGHYSLSIGKGHAIGAVSLAKFLDIQRQAKRTGETILRVKTRNKDSMVCRVADIELLDK